MHSRSSSGGPDGRDPAILDPLTEVLHDLRLSGSFYCRSELRAPWGIEIPRRPVASFHFVAEGGCWLRGAGGRPLHLVKGDLVLLPHGRGHVIADAPGGRATRMDELPHERVGENAAVLRHGGAGARALLICGGVRFEAHGPNPLVELMPEVLLVRASGQGDGLLRATLAAMEAEALAPRAGSATVVTRLADVLVIEAVRSWLDRSAEGRSGWLGALRDPQVGRAVALIHRRPEEPWTVASLARAVHMSRSAFAERFTALAGAPPLHYLTRWRMHLASRWLRQDRLALGEVAQRLGYESEPSFSRAFKRHTGLPPGAVRRGAGPPRAAAAQ